MKKLIIHIITGLCITHAVFSQEADDLYLKGIVMIQKQEFEQAVQFFSQLIENDKFNADFFIKRGEAFYHQGKYFPAINDFKEANRLKKNVADLNLAKSYALLNEQEKMYQSLEQHLNSRYKESESDIKFDPAFTKYQQTAQWVDFWKNEWYSKREYTISEIEYLLKYEKYQQALERVNDELKGRSKNHELYAARASVYVALLNYPKAENDLSKAIGLNSRIGEYYIERSKLLVLLDKPGKAVNDLEKAIELEPQNLELIKLRSLAHQKNNNFEKSEADIKNYLSYFPNEEAAIFQCGNMYYSFEKYLDALVWYNKCLEVNTTRPEYFEARGNAYYQVKTYKYAIRDYSMALDLNPELTNAYVYKGLSRQALGDLQGACSDWQKAYRLGSRKAQEYMIDNCQ